MNADRISATIQLLPDQLPLSHSHLETPLWTNFIFGTDFNDLIIGTADNDVIFASGGNDTIIGADGADTVYGGSGNDFLDGNTGADSLIGGGGDDRYFVGDETDSVAEFVGDGTDVVFTSATFDIRNIDVENLVAENQFSQNDINLFGNDLNNTIDGNSGNNVLAGFGGDDTLLGGEGDDVLIGGAGTNELEGGEGRDIFNFASDSGATTITDFSSADDEFFLSSIVVPALPLGYLERKAFFEGKGARTADQHIIYDNDTGNVYYDHDGHGGKPQVVIVNLSNHLTHLSAADFFIG